MRTRTYIVTAVTVLTAALCAPGGVAAGQASACRQARSVGVTVPMGSWLDKDFRKLVTNGLSHSIVVHATLKAAGSKRPVSEVVRMYRIRYYIWEDYFLFEVSDRRMTIPPSPGRAPAWCHRGPSPPPPAATPPAPPGRRRRRRAPRKGKAEPREGRGTTSMTASSFLPPPNVGWVQGISPFPPWPSAPPTPAPG